MAVLTLDDRSGRIDVTVFSDTLNKYRELIQVDKILICNGEVSLDDFSGRLRMQAREIYDIDAARDHFAKRVILQVNPEIAKNGFAIHLAEALSPYKPGRCPVYIRYSNDSAQGRVPLGEEWKIRPTEELLQLLHQIAGEQNVSLEY